MSALISSMSAQKPGVTSGALAASLAKHCSSSQSHLSMATCKSHSICEMTLALMPAARRLRWDPMWIKRAQGLSRRGYPFIDVRLPQALDRHRLAVASGHLSSSHDGLDRLGER